MALFYVPDIANTWELSDEEAAHALRVLRLSVGATLDITDGKGNLYRTAVASIAGKHCYVEPCSPLDKPKNWCGNVHIAIAPTKNMDRIEWFAEKATEIGFSELTFLDCRFSERKVIKTERVEKILVSAMKQSLKPTLPVLNGMIPFNKFVAQPFAGQKFIAHCYEGDKEPLMQALTSGEDALVLIGPEGDFSPEEVQLAIKYGFRPITLGKSRLRTETAALVAVHVMNLVASPNPSQGGGSQEPQH